MELGVQFNSTQGSKQAHAKARTRKPQQAKASNSKQKESTASKSKQKQATASKRAIVSKAHGKLLHSHRKRQEMRWFFSMFLAPNHHGKPFPCGKYQLVSGFRFSPMVIPCKGPCDQPAFVDCDRPKWRRAGSESSRARGLS